MKPVQLNSQPLMPEKTHPICIIGAGGIVKDAHLPAYKIAGFKVHGITNRNPEKAEALAREFDIEHVYGSLEEMVENAPENTVYDLTLPAGLFADALRKLPDGAAVLIQKPMGENLTDATEILDVCREKSLVAAVNFQLRFAPFITMARDAIQQGLIGELTDLEARITVETPWHLWEFLNDVPSTEIYYHSIHYVDMIRSFLGNPLNVQCKSLASPENPQIDKSRSAYLLDYGPTKRVNIQTNHSHRFGKRHQESYIKWEGTQGAIIAQIGVLKDYPHGDPDWFEICVLQEGEEPEWQRIPVEGSWFPHAFIGSMSTLMHHLENPSCELSHSVEDVYQTMKVVTAAEQATLSGGVKI